MTKKISIIILILLILGAVFYVVQNKDNKSQTVENNQVSESSTLPKLGEVKDLTFKDYSGNEVSLKDFAGTPTIINSWAVWCPFCRDELPDFVELKSEFGGQLKIIAIDREESLDKAKGFTDSIGVSDNLIFLLDPNDKFYKSIGGFGMPETIFVDKEGQIRIHKRGPMDINEMRDKTNQLLQVINNEL